MLLTQKLSAVVPTVPEMPASGDLNAEALRLCEEYVTFAHGPKRSRADARRDFYELCNLPCVTHVAFKEDPPCADKKEVKWLLVGTENVQLKSKDGQLRDIGRFVIRLTRAKIEQPYLFANATRQVMSVGKNILHHPHVGQNGYMCIEGGKNELRAALVDGDMLTATWICFEALRLPTTQDISYWPLAGSEETADA